MRRSDFHSFSELVQFPITVRDPANTESRRTVIVVATGKTGGGRKVGWDAEGHAYSPSQSSPLQWFREESLDLDGDDTSQSYPSVFHGSRGPHVPI